MDWRRSPAGGPGRDGEIKPNLAAPGVEVRSAVPGGYGLASGTSMAAPHVAGAVALILAASGGRGDLNAVRETLDTTAVDTEDLTCGGTPDNNNGYGQGRLDALAATQKVALDSGLAGMVVDADTGEPVAQVLVAMAGTGRSVPTAADGTFRMVAEPGTYTLELSIDGVPVATVPDVAVTDGQMATVDVALAGIRGAVTAGDSGQPLAGARLEVAGAGLGAVTDDQGRFRFRLPPGGYTLEVSRFGYFDVTVPDLTVAAGQVTVADVELDPAPSGTIAGTVTDEISGYGVPDVSVKVLDVPVDLSATTAADGGFEIDGVPAGTYQLDVTTTRPDLWWPVEPIEVTVTADQVAQVAVALPPGGGVDRVSVSSQGGEGDAESGNGTANGSISDDGRYVAYDGPATNLADVPGTGQSGYVYLRDRLTGTTELVPRSPLRPSISGNGRFVAVPGPVGLVDEGPSPERPAVPLYHSFDSRTHVRDRVTGEVDLVSVNSNGEAVDSSDNARPVITADGRYVAFFSHDPLVVAADLPVQDSFLDLWRRLHQQVVVHDRVTGETELVSLGVDGEPADAGVDGQLAITADGRYVAFVSSATNLVEEPTNPGTDIFVHDRETGQTDWVSVLPSSGGLFDRPNYPMLSDDGRFVTYWRGLQPAALHDRETGETVPLAGPGNPVAAITLPPVISGDGNTVAFTSAGIDANGQFLPESTGAFVLDRQSGQLDVLVGTYDGSPPPVGDVLAIPGSISRDGRYVQIAGEHPKLLPGDTNGLVDVYVVDRGFDPGHPRARFVSWNTQVTPAAPLPGEAVQVTASVKNVGDAPGQYEAVLLVDGVVGGPARQEVTLAPGEIAQVTLTTARDSGGDHVVRIGQAAAEFHVQGGSLTGQVTDANDGMPVEATVTATSGDTTRTTSTLSGAYRFDDLQVGAWTVTVEAADYVTETIDVVLAEDGQQLASDVALRTGAVEASSEAISITVPAGSASSASVAVTDPGTADLSWRANAWTATAAERSSILTYSSQPLADGDTHIDLALRRLGLSATSYREQECGLTRPVEFERFEDALEGGEWDLVVVDHICPTQGIPPSTVTALTEHVASGGRLIIYTWQLLHDDSAELLRPLAEQLGVRFSSCFLTFQCPDSEIPIPELAREGRFPAYWWEGEHPLFTTPLSAPEFVRRGELLLDPADGAVGLAGHTPTRRPAHANVVLHNDGRTLVRGFFDYPGINDGDLDRDGVPDAVELWVNSIVHVGQLTVRPWLELDRSGTLAPGEGATVDVSVDATNLGPGTYTGSVAVVTDAGRQANVTVPVTVTVVGCDHTITGRHAGPLTVTEGVTCLAKGSHVVGPITVHPGAGLVATGATVAGPVTATGAVVVALSDTVVRGPVAVEAATGNVDLTGNEITGAVRLAGNATGDTSIVVSDNTITGPLACAANDPPPVDLGTPNTVSGPKSGQCADL